MAYLALGAALQAATSAPDGYGAALLRMLVALVVVCAIAYVALRYGLRWLAPRRGGGQRMEVIEHCSLGGSKGLWIVRVGERRYLLGGAEGGISMLAELEPGELPAAALPKGAFSALLRRGAAPVDGAESEARQDEEQAP